MANILSSTAAVAGVTCTLQRALLLSITALQTNRYIQLDLFEHDIQQAFSTHCFPQCFFYINGQKWQKTAFPATLTPCVCLLTQPQNLISRMSDHAMQNKWCQPQSKELLRLNLNLFRCSCWDEQLLHRLSAEFIIAIAIKNVRYLHLKWQV